MCIRDSYLANYNVSNKKDLQPIGGTAIYPLGVYSTKVKDIKDLKPVSYTHLDVYKRQLIGHDLEAVADTKHRNTGFEYLGVYGRRAGLEHGGRAASQNNRLRILGQDLVDRHGMRDQLGVHACFAHAAGDELGVLGAEVDDKHRTVCH